MMSVFISDLSILLPLRRLTCIYEHHSWLSGFSIFFLLDVGTWSQCGAFIGLFLPCSLCELFFRYNSHHSYLSFSLRLSVCVTLSARVPPHRACHNLLTSPDLRSFPVSDYQPARLLQLFVTIYIYIFVKQSFHLQ